MIETTCKNCGNKKNFDDDKLGKKFKCPSCGNIVVIEKIQKEEISTKKDVKQTSQGIKIWKISALICILCLIIFGTFKGYESYQAYRFEQSQLVDFQSSDIVLSDKLINNGIGTYNGFNSWNQLSKLIITKFTYKANDKKGNVDYKIEGSYTVDKAEIKIDTIINMHFSNEELIKLRQNKEAASQYNNFTFFFQKHKITLTFANGKSVMAYIEETYPQDNSFYLFNTINFNLKEVLFRQFSGNWVDNGEDNNVKVSFNIKSYGSNNFDISLTNLKGTAIIGLFEHNFNNGTVELSNENNNIKGKINIETRESTILGDLKGRVNEGILYCEIIGKVLIKGTNQEIPFAVSKGLKDLSGQSNKNLSENANSVDSIEQHELIATFEHTEMGDYFHIVFNGEDGKRYDFGDGDNNYCGYEFGEETPNHKYIGKKFKIIWKNVITKVLPLGSEDPVDAEVPTIIKIEIIK